MSMKIGMFGGSFDPAHNGHRKLALFMKEALSLDKLIIIPTSMSPFKTTGSDSEDRYNICKLAFPEDFFEVSRIEIERGGKSYTYDTIAEIRKQIPDAELYYIIGSDHLLCFDQWYRYRDILSLVTLCAVSRESALDEEELSRYADEKLRPYGTVRIIDYEPFEISSTEIRRMVSAGGDVRAVLPEGVEEYIKARGLYCDL